MGSVAADSSHSKDKIMGSNGGQRLSCRFIQSE